MKKLLVRHAVSEANDKTSPAFGSPNAKLLDVGIAQADILGEALRKNHNLNPAGVTAATSKLLRTQQTARCAGFVGIQPYSELNEVTLTMRRDEIIEALQTQVTPRAAIVAAQTILEQPPTEQVWITHGLVIAGLCQVLGVSKQYSFIPAFCEIREINI